MGFAYHNCALVKQTTNSQRDAIAITLRNWMFRSHQCLIFVLDGNWHLLFSYSGLQRWTITNISGSSNCETGVISIHEADDPPSCGTNQIEGSLVGGCRRAYPRKDEHLKDEPSADLCFIIPCTER